KNNISSLIVDCIKEVDHEETMYVIYYRSYSWCFSSCFFKSNATNNRQSSLYSVIWRGLPANIKGLISKIFSPSILSFWDMCSKYDCLVLFLPLILFRKKNFSLRDRYFHRQRAALFLNYAFFVHAANY